MKDINVLVLSYNTKSLTLDCLASIFKDKSKIDFDVTVVDNNSSDGTVTIISAKHPQTRIIRSNRNLGFAGGNNLGLKKIFKNYRYTLLLNSDTILDSTTLEKLVSFADKGNYGIVSCRLVNREKKEQPNGGELPFPLPLFYWLSGIDDILKSIITLPSYQSKGFRQGSIGWVSGTVMLVKKEVFGSIGFLDDKIFMYGEDVDFCWRAKNAGFKVGLTGNTFITHLGGGSLTDRNYSQWLGEFRGIVYLYEKYYGKLFSLLVNLLIKIFVLIRVVAFFLVGKTKYAKTYIKVFREI